MAASLLFCPGLRGLADTPNPAGRMDAEAWQHWLEHHWLLEEQFRADRGPSLPVTTASDAAGACDGVKDGTWGFHTGLAADPWWQVDLGGSQSLARLLIWNRCDAESASARADRLLVHLSTDAVQWRRAYQHDATTFFGLTDQKPLQIPLSNLTARFVRIQLPGQQYLHLDEVEIYGAAEPAKNLALHQPADQVSLSQWSRAHPSLEPLDWAMRTRETLERSRQLSRELTKSGVDVTSMRTRIREVAEALGRQPPEQSESAIFFAARRIQRELSLSDPLLDFDAVLFTKRVPATFNHMSDQYYGWWSQPGGGIYLLSHFKAATPTVACLTDSFHAPGSFLRPALSDDGRKVLFAWCHYYPQLAAEANKLDKANVPENAFYHLYEMSIDGTGVRQLTRGKYDDFDGRYLPDGRIVFLSTRRGQFIQTGRESARQTLAQPDLPDCYVRCGGGPERPVAVYTLHTMNADGGGLCAISPFEMFEWTPEVGADGTILFSRWDYIDRDNMPYMGLWAVNPDGTNARLIYGNFTKSPHCTFEAKPVPHSPKIIFTASAHHAQTMGSLVLLDPRVGTEGPDPITRLTPEVPFPEIEGWPKTYYTSPWPLSERLHLVSWGHEGATVPGPPGWDRWHAVRRPNNGMALYLFDTVTGRELLYADPDISCFDPIPVRSRPSSPVLAEHANWDQGDEGRFLLADVYRGLRTVRRGDIKALRLVAVPPKTHPVMNSPNMGLTADDPGKCVLGTVPVEEDGSAYFRAPAGVILFLQALDAQGRAVQTMRSATHVQPDQTLGCIGCHESRQQAPPAVIPSAAQRAPSRIKVGPEGSWPVRFDLLVQPVLNQHCVHCHHPQAEDPKAARFDLTSARAYQSLVTYGKPSLSDQVLAGYRAGFSTEGQGLASRSALLGLLTTPPGHCDLQLDDASLERFTVWMDTYAQRAGAFSADQEQRLQQLRARWADLLVERSSDAATHAQAQSFSAQAVPPPVHNQP